MRGIFFDNYLLVIFELTIQTIVKVVHINRVLVKALSFHTSPLRE